jgi:hypothetical protein
VAAALAGKADVSAIQSDSYLYASDTGAANAYAIALSPTPPTYTAGQMFVFKAANANTGASTLAVNGQAAKALVSNGGAAFSGGEIVAGQMVTAVYDGTQFQLVGGSGSGNMALPNTLSEYRLTLVSGTPVADASGQTLVYLTPFNGDRIALYDGISWSIYSPGEMSIDITSLASSGVYDLFVQLVSSVPTLVAGPQWTDNNHRATVLALQDGIWVLSGDPTQRWVGTIATDGGYMYDYELERFVFNAQNRVPRQLLTNDGTFSTNSNSWSGILNINIVIGEIAEAVLAWATALGAGDGVSTACELITNWSDQSSDTALAGTIGTSCLTAPFNAQPTQLGIVSPTLFFQSSIGGNTVNLLDDGSSNALTYLTGIMWG